MAGVTSSSPAAAPAGVFGPMARRQYAALARMRWEMFKNNIRTSRGALEVGARALSYLMYSGMSLGIGIGAGVSTYAIVHNQQWQLLPIPFWVLFLLWQMVPLVLASFQEQYEMGGLLRFPVGFGSFYLLYLVFGLIDVSTIMGVVACAGIWVGLVIAMPGEFAWAALGLALFACFNILLVRAILAWIDRWLAQRRTREIVGAVGLILVLCMQMLNPALHPTRQNEAERQAQARTQRQIAHEFMPWMARVNAAQRWLPAGSAAQSIRQSAEAQPVPAVAMLGVLCAWMLAAGGALGIRLKAEFRGENLGEAPAAKKKLEARSEAWQLGGTGPITAIFEKELRALMRTNPLLFAMGAPVVVMFAFSGIFGGGNSGAHSFPFVLPALLIYVQLGFTQLFYNNLGTEGFGVQIYFLSPTPIRTVMLAKNILCALLFALAAVLGSGLMALRAGVPPAVILAATAAWLLFYIPCNLAVGNIFSLIMPYRINPGKISRQRGSQASALLSMLVQLGAMGVGAAVFGLSWLLGQLWVAIPVFLGLSAIAASVWWAGLKRLDSMANKRRESLIAVLAKTE